MVVVPEVKADKRDAKAEIRQNVKQALFLAKCLHAGHPKFRDSEPTDISSIELQTSGDIGPDAPVLPAQYVLLTKGDPDNPLAMVVHGFLETADTMRYVVSDLADAGYYAVAPYIRGAYPTQSDLTQPQSALTYLIQDLVELTFQLADPTQENVFLGSDFGSIAGQVVMAVQPEPFYKKFVSFGNIAPLPATEVAFSNFEGFRGFFFGGGFFQIAPSLGIFFRDEAVNQFRTMDLFADLWAYLDPFGSNPTDLAFAEMSWLATDTSLENGLNYPRGLYLAPVPPISFPQPALYVVNKLDGGLVWPSNKEKFDEVRRVSEATKVGGPDTIKFAEMPCSGHFPQIEDPDKLRRIILRFLDRHGHHSRHDPRGPRHGHYSHY
ncbi:MAG: alpha/beta hydrolase [Myxococcales bacterium]|nr:alpha/beta hydrolase [Myxococcales bacterium]